jgi:hypothetical protein
VSEKAPAAAMVSIMVWFLLLAIWPAPILMVTGLMLFAALMAVAAIIGLNRPARVRYGRYWIDKEEVKKE